MQTHWMRYVWALVTLTILAIIAILISISVPSASTSQRAPIGFPENTPAPKAADAAAMQKGFNALVSFTDRGFDPSTITLKKGDTIRFTNNASTDLLLSSTDSLLLGIGAPIVPRRYAERTFDESGQFHYSDATTGRSGTIVVR